MKVNFREPNVDRFVEILALAYFLKIPIGGGIKNMPNGYSNFVSQIDSCCLSDNEIADFVCEYPEKTNFIHCFNVRFEEIKDIKQRIFNANPISEDRFDNAGQAILKNYVEKMNVDRDGLQAILNMSFVIASLAGHTYMKAEDIAEACQYYKNTLKY